MNRIFAFLGVSFTIGVFLVSGCIGSDPEAETAAERSRGMCSDGKDNDGDGHFDCYDTDCRAVHDSLLRLDITDTLCHYERVRNWVAQPSSSLISSSSSAPSSSGTATSSSSSRTGFPYEIRGNASDSTQILALSYRPASGAIALAGRMGNRALYGILDTNARSLFAVNAFSTPPSLVSGLNLSSEIRREFTALDTNLQGQFVAVGRSVFANGSLATSFHYNFSDQKLYNFYVPHEQFVYFGYNTPSTECLVTNDSGSGFVLVDVDITDTWMASVTNSLSNAVMARGEVTGTRCAGIGTRTVADSTQIWLLITSQTNNPDITRRISTGTSKSEVAYDLEIRDSLVYIAAKVDNQIRLLVYHLQKDSVIAASASLGPGRPWTLRQATVNGQNRLILVGESGGRGSLWLFDLSGVLQDQKLLDSAEAQALTDIIALNNGYFLASGWKSSTSSSSGTVGIIVKLGPSLSIIP